MKSDEDDAHFLQYYQVTNTDKEKSSRAQRDGNVRCLLTSGETVPDLYPVVAAEHAGRGCRVGLQLKALKLQDDL